MRERKKKKKTAEANFGRAHRNDQHAVSFANSSIEIANVFRWVGITTPAEILPLPANISRLPQHPRKYPP